MKRTVLGRIADRLRQSKSRRTLAAILRHAMIEPYRLEITHQEIRIRRLPAEFHGFRIVQISDTHHSPFLGSDGIASACARANALEPDITVLTGDYISHSADYIAGCARALGTLKAKRGVFAVLGNHDHWTDGEMMASQLRRQGIRVLENENLPIESNDKRLWLAGIDDMMVGRHDLPRALTGTAPSDVKILLSHNPAIIRDAWRAGIDLVLSGHTHGGQINWRLLVGRDQSAGRWLRRPSRRFIRGHATLGDTQLYVNRGLGTVVVPLRYGCPPEITLLELTR